MRGHHRGAGMTSAEDRRGPAVTHRFCRDTDRGQRLPPQRARRRLRHLDALRRVRDLYIDGVSSRRTREDILDDVPIADEQQGNPVTSGGAERPAYDCVRRMVTAHGVDGDSHHG